MSVGLRSGTHGLRRSRSHGPPPPADHCLRIRDARWSPPRAPAKPLAHPSRCLCPPRRHGPGVRHGSRTRHDQPGLPGASPAFSPEALVRSGAGPRPLQRRAAEPPGPDGRRGRGTATGQMRPARPRGQSVGNCFGDPPSRRPAVARPCRRSGVFRRQRRSGLLQSEPGHRWTDLSKRRRDRPNQRFVLRRLWCRRRRTYVLRNPASVLRRPASGPQSLYCRCGRRNSLRCRLRPPDWSTSGFPRRIEPRPSPVWGPPSATRRRLGADDPGRKRQAWAEATCTGPQRGRP
jgi:hypothetical protein